MLTAAEVHEQLSATGVRRDVFSASAVVFRFSSRLLTRPASQKEETATGGPSPLPHPRLIRDEMTRETLTLSLVTEEFPELQTGSCQMEGTPEPGKPDRGQDPRWRHSPVVSSVSLFLLCIVVCVRFKDSYTHSSCICVQWESSYTDTPTTA